MLCGLFFSRVQVPSSSYLDYMFHSQPCHIKLWQASVWSLEYRLNGVWWAPTTAHLCPGLTSISCQVQSVEQVLHIKSHPVLASFLNSTMDKHWLCRNRLSSVALPTLAGNFLTRWKTELLKDHGNTPQEELRFSHSYSMLCLGIPWKMWQMFLLVLCW
jgi:hypothetical protein